MAATQDDEREQGMKRRHTKVDVLFEKDINFQLF